MSVTISQVDAFTDTPFSGNPAGVCVLSRSRSTDWMQQVAREMNCSETAFVRPEGEQWSLRWFTPTHEVDLCGHATLASAHVLWEEGHSSQELISFRTKSGTLTARREDGRIAMTFPAEPAKPLAPVPDGLEAALGTTPEYVGQNRMDWLVRLNREEQVCQLSPDIAQLEQFEVRGIIVTAPSASEEYHFVSRFFAPRVGVPEDPVTGSAHCCLGPYWTEELGEARLVGRQVSPRGGTVRVDVSAGNDEQLELAGRAVTTLRAELLV